MRTTAGQPPLLVTGLPRSGTSWVGKMLEASGQVVYVNEPLNPRHPPGHSPGVLDARVTHQFQYICPDNEEQFAPAFADTVALRYGFAAELRRNRGLYDLGRLAKYGTTFTLGRLRGRRAMLDDPYAILSVRWLAERLGAQVVVLVRDPVALVGSWRRLGWRAHLPELLAQPLLLRDLLGERAAELRSAAASSDDLAQAAALWRLVADIVGAHYRDLPGVTIRRYEDMAREPIAAFADLYRFFGLDFTDRVRRRVMAATSGGNHRAGAHRWTLRFGLSRTAFRPMDSAAMLESHRQDLSEEEVARIRDLTGNPPKSGSRADATGHEEESRDPKTPASTPPRASGV